jgi:hypothetical protein
MTYSGAHTPPTMVVDDTDVSEFNAYIGGRTALVMVDDFYGIEYSKEWNTFKLVKRMPANSVHTVSIARVLTAQKPGSQLPIDVYLLSKIVRGTLLYSCLRRDWQPFIFEYSVIYHTDPETTRLVRTVFDHLMDLHVAEIDIELSLYHPRRCLTPDYESD